MTNHQSPFYNFILLLKVFSLISIAVVLILLIYLPLRSSLDTAISKTFKPLPAAAIEASKGAYKYENPNKIVNGIHVRSGLAYDQNFRIVKAVCTRCHSAKLVTQMKATRQGWEEMILWMQETQGLEELGEYKKPILDYLSKHYAPTKMGRRSNLEIKAEEWYVLNLDEE